MPMALALVVHVGVGDVLAYTSNPEPRFLPWYERRKAAAAAAAGYGDDDDDELSKQTWR